MKIFHKLVRDRIPQIISQNGQKPVTRILQLEEYSEELERKLDEEVWEYHQDKNAEELADILEVVFALGESLGVSQAELLQIRDAKREKRGGFSDRIFLIATEEATD